MKQKLLLSFSGGRTSAFMVKYMLESFSHLYDMIVVFANTGQELEETLIFVDRCDKEWGFNTVWVEALFHKGYRINKDGVNDSGVRRKGKATTHTVVTFETACRGARLFKDMVEFADYGIPNVSYLHCTRELKTAAIYSYLHDEAGWEKGEYQVAIGMREDEPTRTKPKAGIIYPLATINNQTKHSINTWFSKQAFNLDLMEHEGNCTWCFKKSLKKHMMLMGERPEAYDVPTVMECENGLNGYHTDKNKRVFFRGNRGVFDLIQMYHAQKKNNLDEQVSDEIITEDITMECGESCEAF